MKETWSAINKLVNKRLKADGITIFDSRDIANSMNQFFCAVGEKLSNDIPEAGNPLPKDENNLNHKKCHSQLYSYNT